MVPTHGIKSNGNVQVFLMLQPDILSGYTSCGVLCEELIDFFDSFVLYYLPATIVAISAHMMPTMRLT